MTMRRFLTTIQFSTVFCYTLVLTGLIAAAPIQAAVWHASVGAQSADKGNQALAFLPSELWIHAGDRIAFKFPTAEPHTVSFLMGDNSFVTPGQIRPPFAVGCPPTPDGSSV